MNCIILGYLILLTPLFGMLERDNVDRRSNISVEEFIKLYEIPNIPVILEGIGNDWNAYKAWNRNKVIPEYEPLFYFGSLEKKFEKKYDNYYTYYDHFNDISPSKIFCDDNGNQIATSGNEFNTPIYFKEDLFSVLGDKRPDFRWLLIGPVKSGSTFHQDPDCSSAWSVCFQGHKKFVFFPPEALPPGVTRIGDNFFPPECVVEWFIYYYNESIIPYECVIGPGEILFVPSGWWHIVLNLDETIAISHNFVSQTTFPLVYEYLKDNKSEMFKEFKSKLQEIDYKPLEILEKKKRLDIWENNQTFSFF